MEEPELQEYFMINQELHERCYKTLAENLPMLKGKRRLSQEDSADIVEGIDLPLKTQRNFVYLSF